MEGLNLLEFQKPTRYIDKEINSIHKDGIFRFALLFPDTYEIGMSHLGMKILYHILNGIEGVVAERVFAPWVDLKEALQRQAIPLRSLESNRPLREFDVLGISLQYELSYTTALKMLNLGGIPLKREERAAKDPIVLAGGPCTVNPAPLEPFIDAFFVGEAEEAIVESVMKLKGCPTREDKLRALSEIEGFYVPGYTKGVVKRRFVHDLDSAPYPTAIIVPYMQIVHDRVNIEVSRGCTRGCRFCQAGMIYRPLRERSPQRVLKLVEDSLKRTGYEEVSFTSLSIGDYSCLLSLLRGFNKRFSHKRVSLSLPSIRVGAINREILKEIKAVKKSGFTIAPEAATERLRRAINKTWTEEDFQRAIESLFSEGWLNLKLYYMIGLPTEEEEDIYEICKMSREILQMAKRHTRKHVNITVSISPFVPKPFTPFQWYGQLRAEEMKDRVEILKRCTPRGINLKVHDLRMSLLEAALSRADSAMSALLEEVVRQGAYLEGWSEHFDMGLWERAMDKTGIDLYSYAPKTYQRDDILPWDGIDTGVRKDYLWKEWQRAISSEETSDCNQDRCHGCGVGCRSQEFLNKECIVGDYQIGVTKKFSPVGVRIKYTKLAQMKYLSTLELMNTLLRALRRAEVDIAYTAGFSPSPKISMGPALSVGIESTSEYFDIKVHPPFDIIKIKERINNQMPEGIEIIEISFIHQKVPSLNSFISRYDYEVKPLEGKSIKLNLFSLSHKAKSCEFLESFDILRGGGIFLRLKDTKNKKAKIREILEDVFGINFNDVIIVRKGQYGYYKGRFYDPMEILKSYGK